MANPKKSVEVVSVLAIKDHMALTFNNEFPPFEGTRSIPFTIIREGETSKQAAIRMMKDDYNVEAVPALMLDLQNYYSNEVMYIIQTYLTSIKGDLKSTLPFSWSSAKSLTKNEAILAPIVKLSKGKIFEALEKDGKFI